SAISAVPLRATALPESLSHSAGRECSWHWLQSAHWRPQPPATCTYWAHGPPRSNKQHSEVTMSIADEVFAIYQRRGSGAYFGEHVSMTEHGLQAAYFACQESAPRVLVLAALLHDIGHLIDDDVPDDLGDWT